MGVLSKWRVLGVFDGSTGQRTCINWLYSCLGRIKPRLDFTLAKQKEAFEQELRDADLPEDEWDELKQCMAVQIHINKLSFLMKESGAFSEQKTWRLAQCAPLPLRLDATVHAPRTCGIRLCPWCHARKIKQLSRQIVDPNVYSVCRLIERVHTGSLGQLPTPDIINAFRARTVRLSRRSKGPYMSTFQLRPDYDRKNWLMRATLLVPRGKYNLKEKERWFNYSSKYKLLQGLYPYPAEYLTLGATAAVGLVQSLHDRNSLTVAKDYTYGLKPKTEED